MANFVERVLRAGEGKRMKVLEKQGVEFIEQPMPAAMIEETRWVRSRVPNSDGSYCSSCPPIFWCGGRNIAAEYFEGDPARRGGKTLRNHAWHDLSFDLRGELAVRACEQFEKDWAYATRTPLVERCAPTPHSIVAGEAPAVML